MEKFHNRLYNEEIEKASKEGRKERGGRIAFQQGKNVEGVKEYIFHNLVSCNWGTAVPVPQSHDINQHHNVLIKPHSSFYFVAEEL